MSAPMPGEVHGHEVQECTDDMCRAVVGLHKHDDPTTDSGAAVVGDCPLWCIAVFVRREPTPEPTGLYGKYRVTKASDGSEVSAAFALRPDRDEAARAALLAYADETSDSALAEDLWDWAARCSTPEPTPEFSCAQEPRRGGCLTAQCLGCAESKPEPWAGHPIKWCNGHDSITHGTAAVCDLHSHYDNECEFEPYPPVAELVAKVEQLEAERNQVECSRNHAVWDRHQACVERDQLRAEVERLSADLATQLTKEPDEDHQRALREIDRLKADLAKATDPLPSGDELSLMLRAYRTMTYSGASPSGLTAAFEAVMRRRGFRP